MFGIDAAGWGRAARACSGPSGGTRPARAREPAGARGRAWPGAGRAPQPPRAGETGDLEFVVVDREAVARIGELLLREPREDIVARDLGLDRGQHIGIVEPGGAILRARRLHAAAHPAAQGDLVAGIGADREIVVVAREILPRDGNIPRIARRRADLR